MSLSEIETNIEELSIRDKAHLLMSLLKDIDESNFQDMKLLNPEDIVSRSKDDISYFSDYDLVMQDAKSKYL